MPCLDAAQLEGDHAQTYVFSVMLQPRNAEAQANLFKVLKNERDLHVYEQWRPAIKAFGEEFRSKVEDTLWESRAVPTLDEMQPYYAEGLERGRRAGRILNWILEHQASLNQAFDEFAEPRLLQRTQKDHWQSMVPAVHLWAAALQHPIPGDSRLVEWLSTAEEIRRQGEAFIPTHGWKPILDPDQMWHLQLRKIQL